MARKRGASGKWRGGSTREGNQEARHLLDQALALEPEFVPALVLGDSCWHNGLTNGWVLQAEGQEHRHRYARLAVYLTPDDADALSALAVRTPAISGDKQDALSLANRAVAANPKLDHCTR